MIIALLKKIMKRKGIDVCIFYNLDTETFEKNMYYFSRYKGIGALVVFLKNSPFLIVPLMEVEKAENCPDLKVYEWKKGKRLFENIDEVLKKKRIKPRKMGIIFQEFRLDAFKSLKKYIKKIRLVDISRECFELRAIKTEEEIKLLEKSADISSTIIGKCAKNFRKFKTEKEMLDFLRLETVGMGCELAFEPVVASGNGSSMPHYEAKDIKLKNGFCVVDFGVKYNGYCSDITRTFYLGSPNKKEKKIYNIVLASQEAVIKNIKEGRKCFKAYEKAAYMLGQYKDNFIHGLGHGVGLNIHELPNLKLNSEDVFHKNMVFTVEPGIYFKNKYGIRIEDTILLKDGPVILTKFPKKLIVIKR